MDQKSRKRFYGLLILSLVLLFNPNINIFDPLPDFIAWFILAKLFEKAADAAAYFEEARVSFLKLAWINIAKFPAFLFILMVRGENVHDNDVYALISLTFAIVEAILVIQAIKNIFAALTHLGDRTSAESLIKPFALNKHGFRTMPVDALKGYTYFFAICKSALYALPDMFLLTRVNEKGQILTASRYYPLALILAQILGLILGIVWLKRILKYAKSVYKEGLFDEALEFMASEDTQVKLETKKNIRVISFALTLMAVASIFMLDISLDSFNMINILPCFIFGIFLIISLCTMRKYISKNIALYISGFLFVAISALAYVFSLTFHSSYEYLDLIKNSEARNAYLYVQIFGVAEFIAITAFLLIFIKTLKEFILNNTGVNPQSDRYLKMEKDYHKSLFTRAYIFIGLGILSALAKCVNIFLNSDVQYVFTNINEVMIAASPIPWFNLVVTATAIFFIAYSLYFTSYLKEEVKMKFTRE